MHTIVPAIKQLALSRRAIVIPLALLLGAAFARRASSQLPTRLPAVVVNADPEPPGPRKIVGIVRDTLTTPLDQVEISIAALRRRALTQRDGSFRFDSVPPGRYEIRARKLGFAPQIRPFVVDSAGGTGSFTLLPLARSLVPVVTSAVRGGLSGVVGDTAFNAIGGALVRLVGHSDKATTDSVGAFFIPARPGNYVVSITRPGYDYRLASVIIPPDSGRHIAVMLPPGRVVPVREAHNLDDFGDRLVRRQFSHSKVYTRPDLEKLGVDWAHDAVKRAADSFRQTGDGTIDRDCRVIVNGGPSTVELSTLTIDDVETIEVYLGGRSPNAAGRSSVLSVPITNAREALILNGARRCPIVYIWLR